MRDVDGLAAHLEAKPDHPDLRTHHPAAGRLRNETGVRAIAALQRREGTDTGALLLDDGLKVDPCRRSEACGLDCVQRVERADGARLHVEGAAPIHPAVADNRREWRGVP